MLGLCHRGFLILRVQSFDFSLLSAHPTHARPGLDDGIVLGDQSDEGPSVEVNCPIDGHSAAQGTVTAIAVELI